MDDGELWDLLGAYALDALDADETTTVEELLRRDPVAAAEAARLSEAATWIGATEALAPPSRLRESVLTDATRRAEVRAYRAEADRFDALLDAVDESDYDQPTWNGLSVRELVAHLAGMETSCAEGVGSPVGLDAPVGVEARTEVFVAAYPDPQAARLVLRDAVDSLAGWAEAGGEIGRFPWWGSEAPRRNLLAGRAFELWTHGDDIRRTIGLDLEPPDASTLRIMSDVAVRTLPIGLGVQGKPLDGRVVRIVLTGDGGGDWVIGARTDAPPVHPDVTITADVLDFCRLTAERITPAEIEYSVEGDPGLARDLVGAASAFATL